MKPPAAPPAQVVHVLLKMLTMTSVSARPAGAEAQRILGFFMSALANRQLVSPAPLAEMPSWTVLTPCYEEDVLYPLDGRHAAEDMGARARPPAPPSCCLRSGAGSGEPRSESPPPPSAASRLAAQRWKAPPPIRLAPAACTGLTSPAAPRRPDDPPKPPAQAWTPRRRPAWPTC